MICDAHRELVAALRRQQREDRKLRGDLDRNAAPGRKQPSIGILAKEIQWRHTRLMELEFRASRAPEECAACDLIRRYDFHRRPGEGNVLEEVLSRASSTGEPLSDEQVVGSSPARGSTFGS